MGRLWFLSLSAVWGAAAWITWLVTSPIHCYSDNFCCASRRGIIFSPQYSSVWQAWLLGKTPTALAFFFLGFHAQLLKCLELHWIINSDFVYVMREGSCCLGTTVDNFQKTGKSREDISEPGQWHGAARGGWCFRLHSCWHLFETGLPCWRKMSWQWQSLPLILTKK